MAYARDEVWGCLGRDEIEHVLQFLPVRDIQALSCTNRVMWNFCSDYLCEVGLAVLDSGALYKIGWGAKPISVASEYKKFNSMLRACNGRVKVVRGAFDGVFNWQLNKEGIKAMKEFRELMSVVHYIEHVNVEALTMLVLGPRDDVDSVREWVLRRCAKSAIHLGGVSAFKGLWNVIVEREWKKLWSMTLRMVAKGPDIDGRVESVNNVARTLALNAPNLCVLRLRVHVDHAPVGEVDVPGFIVNYRKYKKKKKVILITLIKRSMMVPRAR